MGHRAASGLGEWGGSHFCCFWYSVQGLLVSVTHPDPSLPSGGSSLLVYVAILTESLLFFGAGISNLGLLSRAEKAWKFKYSLIWTTSEHTVAQRQSFNQRNYPTQKAGLLSLMHHCNLRLYTGERPDLGPSSGSIQAFSSEG